jgi:protein-L-isoaspartate O-methyltransferase
MILLALLAGAAWTREPEKRKRDGPAYVTPKAVIAKAIELAKVKKTDRVYDLAGDDARFAVAVARRVKARVVAIGLDDIFEEDAGENVAQNKVQHLVTLRKHDITKDKLDLSKTDVIYFCTLPAFQKVYLERFKGVRPGTRLVTYLFPLEGVKPKQVVKVRDECNREHTVYLYVAPLTQSHPKKGGK